MAGYIGTLKLVKVKKIKDSDGIIMLSLQYKGTLIDKADYYLQEWERLKHDSKPGSN